MLTSTRQNFHRSKLPKLGEAGTITGLSTVNPKRKCIVVAFPLCDGAQWRGKFLSIGIHTFIVRFLDNGQTARFAGQWFQPVEG